ncbi:cytidine deaminase [Puniceicoccaceae bacterium K14]|nr:cytidine deaminase [Puniceicoccaceae bacterium K14]
MISEDTIGRMVPAAQAARANAYAPYSNYKVGAAVLGASGKVYAGANVENASFGLTNCAERSAIFNAISEGEEKIIALVLVLENGGVPCGACRQVMNEFNPDLEIIVADPDGKVAQQLTLVDLLPNAFGPKNLGK